MWLECCTLHTWVWGWGDGGLTSSPLGSVMMKGLLHIRIPVVSLFVPLRHWNPTRGSSSCPIQVLSVVTAVTASPWIGWDISVDLCVYIKSKLYQKLSTLIHSPVRVSNSDNEQQIRNATDVRSCIFFELNRHRGVCLPIFPCIGVENPEGTTFPSGRRQRWRAPPPSYF